MNPLRIKHFSSGRLWRVGGASSTVSNSLTKLPDEVTIGFFTSKIAEVHQRQYFVIATSDEPSLSTSNKTARIHTTKCFFQTVEWTRAQSLASIENIFRSNDAFKMSHDQSQKTRINVLTLERLPVWWNFKHFDALARINYVSSTWELQLHN